MIVQNYVTPQVNIKINSLNLTAVKFMGSLGFQT
jgi:hypothetical protein